MVMTNSTYDGLCYNVDAIKQTLGDTVEVLHFDEAWYAYANFHEFYDGYHAISSAHPARSPHAITFATQSTHKLLAALSQASMIHVQHGENAAAGHDALQRGVHDAHLDLAAVRHHRLLRCRGRDDGAAGRPGARAGDHRRGAELPPRHDRRCRQQLDGSLVVRRLAAGCDGRARRPTSKSQLGAEAGRQVARVRGISPQNHVLVDPIKVTILTPGLAADGTMQEHGIPAAVVTKFLSSRRIEIEKTGLYSFLVLFSMGITKGKWSTLVTELLNFKDLYDANAPLDRVLPALAEAHPEAYAKHGAQGSLRADPRRSTARTICRKAQQDMYTMLPEMAMRPADAYDRLVRGQVESVEIDNLMGRMLAVMVVPYPPGIPLIMPGERITAATKSIQDYLLYAREFDQQVPRLRDRHPRPALRADAASGRRYLVDCVARRS